MAWILNNKTYFAGIQTGCFLTLTISALMMKAWLIAVVLGIFLILCISIDQLNHKVA
jgi:hypothetical protein